MTRRREVEKLRADLSVLAAAVAEEHDLLSRRITRLEAELVEVLAALPKPKGA